MRALRCGIFRDGKGDYSNHGISSRHNEVLVICPDGPVEIDENNLPDNLCKVVKRDLGFAIHIHIEPYAEAKGVGYMYGGTIIDASDSRFGRVTGVDYPVRFHDRDESQEMYDMLSR